MRIHVTAIIESVRFFVILKLISLFVPWTVKRKMRVVQDSLISESWTTLLVYTIVRVQLRWQHPYRHLRKGKRPRFYHRVG